VIPSQLSIFYSEHKKIAAVNEQFLMFVKDGLTRDQLARLIEKRPANWSRFSNWLKVLPADVVQEPG
jgi:hypothetical protein